MLLFTAAIVLAISGCSSTSPPPGIAPVTPFDLARYEGRWYEVARLDHSFERGMTDVSATYQRQSDGTVQVLNRGFDTGKNDWRQAEGKAKFTGDKNSASLKVSFFGPFYGGYHVAALDADYQWALVVGPDRSYCWILSRTKQLPPGVFDAFGSFVFNMGCAKFRSYPVYTLLLKQEYSAACARLPLYVYGGGVKLPGLVDRRGKEKALCLAQP